jgi:hypothetical protein
MVGPREHAISLAEHLVLSRIQKICKYFRVYFHELIRAKMNDYLHNSSQNDEIAMGSWPNSSRRTNLLQEGHKMELSLT